MSHASKREEADRAVKAYDEYRYPEKGCYRVGCVAHGGPPCTVCGKQSSEHGSYPTCASHPYSPNGRCGHVGTYFGGTFIGAVCSGAECKNGCAAIRAASTPTP